MLEPNFEKADGLGISKQLLSLGLNGAVRFSITFINGGRVSDVFLACHKDKSWTIKIKEVHG